MFTKTQITTATTAELEELCNLRAEGEAARFPGSAPTLGGREDLRVAEPGSPSEQGLREAAGDGGGHDLRRDEPAHAAQAGACSVKDFTLVPQIRCLQNSFLEDVNAT
jgi:hypothetical protein